MTRVRTIRCRFGPDAAWLAALAMLCQLLAPALSSQHHAALAYELAQATSEHHGDHGGGMPAGDPASCVVHMALHAASGPLASPPPPLPIRLGSKAIPPQPVADVIETGDRQWRPQSVRAPPHSVFSSF